MTKDEKQVADLILSDPDGGRMVISSELRHEADGAMRFTVTNPKTGRRFGVYLGLAELTADDVKPAPKVGNVVMFRPGRMHGYPEQHPSPAMVTAVRKDCRVDLEIGCDGVSQVSGEAGAVPHIRTLTKTQREQCACWWEAENGDRLATLTEMAYLLKLVPRGDIVPVQILEVVGLQFDAALQAAGFSA